MKKLSFFNKIIYTVNVLFIVGLIFSFFAPYLPPQKFGILSLISLTVPILIFANLVFLVYWIVIGFKKQLIPTAIVLILSLFFIPSLYKFSSDATTSDKEVSIMTYNVRKFNMYEWLKDKNIDTKITEFISNENPDILAIQEFKEDNDFTINYPFKYNPFSWKKNRSGLALYSKYEIINSGVVKQHNINWKAIFIDIIKNNDTIRIYNFHLQSLGLNPDAEFFGHSDSEKLLKRLRTSFKLQEEEIDTLANHINKCNYKVILVGDMNNTPYSWSYKNLKENLQDSFIKAGNGFGKTYNFNGFPLRIDYIFVDKDITVNQHKNYTVKYSDHFPVMATVSF